MAEQREARLLSIFKVVFCQSVYVVKPMLKDNCTSWSLVLAAMILATW